MVYNKCVVKGCTTTSLKKNIALFDTPDNEALFARWQENIITNDGQPITVNSKVCELHFNARCIRKEIVSHRNYKNSLRSVLSRNAIPCLKLGQTEVKESTSDAAKQEAVANIEVKNETDVEQTHTADISTDEAAIELTENSIQQEETNIQETNNSICDLNLGDNHDRLITRNESELEQVPLSSTDGGSVSVAPEESSDSVKRELAVEENTGMPSVEEPEISEKEMVNIDREGKSESLKEISTAPDEENMVLALESIDNTTDGDTAFNEKDVDDHITADVNQSDQNDFHTTDGTRATVYDANVNEEMTNSPQSTSVTEGEPKDPNGEICQKTSDINTYEAEIPVENMCGTGVRFESNSGTVSITDNEVKTNTSSGAIEVNMKDAAIEAGKLDVLVCGNCHTIFHFIEEFQAHKSAAVCNETSSLKSNITEPKPQVWAFLIWKNSQIEDGSSWKLYQKWCQMTDSEKSVWIAAGARLQECAAVSRLKHFPKESSEKINRTLQKSPNRGQIRPPHLTASDKKHLDDAERIGTSNNLRTNLDSEGEFYSSGIDDSDSLQRPEASDGIVQSFQIKEEVTSDDGESNLTGKVRKPQSRPAKSGTTADDEEEDSNEEYSVERIVARRYNTKKKQFEYLLKWEGYPPDQNTWEPADNLSDCQHLLKAYEANIAKMQQNAKMKSTLASPKVGEKVNEQGRPIRNSKQKALSQVKEWCGTMRMDESGKRRNSDSTDDEGPSGSKKMKLDKNEMFSAFKYSSRTESPKTAVNGVPERQQVLSRLAAELGIGPDSDSSPNKSIKPVVRSISSLSQQNQEVLVASAKGVVKVDPSQVPNLSSGVYIMSNKSGIVKLDSLSPQKALSSLRKTGVLPQTSKGGVVVLQSPTQRGVPKSGIVRKNQVPQKVQEALPNSPKVPVHRSILPRSLLNNSPRPTGLLRPSGTSTPRPLQRIATPRVPVSSTRPPPLSKIQFPPLRPRGPNPVGRPPKDRVKPIQSILGSALLASEDKVAALKGKSLNVSPGTLLKKSVAKPQSSPSAKLVDNDKILMEFHTAKSDSDSDYGLEDDFPSDLPPIEAVENSPPRPLTLDPYTGERLAKAEGERTPSPEPTPPPTPPPKTPEPAPSSESTESTETIDMQTEHSSQGHFIKVEMSPGGTTGMVTEALSNSQEEGAEFASLGDECNVGGLRVKKILSPSSELEHQQIILQQQEGVMMEGVETGDDIIHVTGEDGTVYQVSSSQLNGETILLEGAEGTQQCVFVTQGGEDGSVLAIDPSQYANSVGQLMPEQMEASANGAASITIESGEGEDQAQVVAQLVEAGEPCGGGLRKVVLMLPDGNLMMTEVDEEQFAALELDK
nr:PREDICTED: uncharacterized protein LOC109032473 isoform X1 [Bemisia tabaci]XP_018900169.1 PREDICTED: uncharacterized protein LOC109032473 isoform X2 [Bemisia tabaci]